jgi:hypothetical protein
MRAVLDAENSDRYRFEQDFRPAINSSVEWLQAVFNKAFAEKKLTEENLRELIRTVIYQTNSFSRIYFNEADLGFKIWSVMRINPEPVIYPDGATITATSTPEESVYRDDLTYRRSKYSAKRLTLEEWEETGDNIFEAGNSRLLNSFKSYAFLGWVNYTSSGYSAGGAETEIRPEVINDFVGVTFLKYPTPINLISDSIEFPDVLTDLIYTKALNFISFKQGDQTNLYNVTAQDVNTLIPLMI